LNELVTQVQRLVDDASYQGLNLLNSTASTLSVRFSEKTDSKLDINGVNFNASLFYLDSDGAALSVALQNASEASLIGTNLGFEQALELYTLSDAAILACFNAQADTVIKSLERTVTNLRSKAATIAQNASILKVRLDFTSEYTNVLQEGADKLTLADLNEEGANLLALQTRQQLGIQALSFAGQAEQSIIGLFR
jgi:flagellin-like hook-associated protein FlgL